MKSNFSLEEDLTEDIAFRINVCNTFEHFTLQSGLIRGLERVGIYIPCPVQQEALPWILQHRDIILQAKSRSGKTYALIIAVLQLIDVKENLIQAIIIVPTRELARQICSNVLDLGVFLGVRCINCIGGTRFGEDRDKISTYGPHVLVATAGRLGHLFRSNIIVLAGIRALILDEADMLFLKAHLVPVAEFVQLLRRRHCQVCIGATTMPKEALVFARANTRDPVERLLHPEELTLECVEQFYVKVENHREKLIALTDLYDDLVARKVIVYCNRREGVEIASDVLERHEYAALKIHGGLAQEVRNSTMLRFQGADTGMLISSDLLARGVDMEGVTYVVNFDVPWDVSNYLHRNGRSKRARKKGMSITFALNQDIAFLERVEAVYDTNIFVLPPTFMHHLEHENFVESAEVFGETE